MKKAAKPEGAKLTTAQVCMSANFADAAFDYPRKSFSQIARRLLGAKGFPKTKNGMQFKRECHEVFDLERRK